MEDEESLKKVVQILRERKVQRRSIQSLNWFILIFLLTLENSFPQTTYLAAVTNRILQFLFASPLLILMVIIVFINIKIEYKPEVKIVQSDTIHHETLLQLRGLKQALKENADVEMQSLYPEGYVFLNALYALVWADFITNGNHSQYKDEGQAEIERAWLKISSETGRSSFSEELPLPYGAFYNGWSSYVLGKKLQTENLNERDAQVKIFKEQCRRIALVLEDTPYPVSYYGAAWPADVVLCVATLSLHDKLFNPLYTKTIEQWVKVASATVDELGMLPHSFDPGAGKLNESARGSSMALMLIFLREIDLSFANEQFILFKRNFIDTTFGLTGVREYPKGKSGIGDVDSGPVLFGYGGAATIVGAKTLALYGDHEISSQIRSAVEAMAFAYKRDDSKKYFVGYLPIVDAFITWGDVSIKSKWKDPSFVRFRIFSFIVFGIVAVLFWMFVEPGNKDRKGKMAVEW